MEQGLKGLLRPLLPHGVVQGVAQRFILRPLLLAHGPHPAQEMGRQAPAALPADGLQEADPL